MSRDMDSCLTGIYVYGFAGLVRILLRYRVHDH